MILELFVKGIEGKKKCIDGPKTTSSEKKNRVVISNFGGLWLPGHF